MLLLTKEEDFELEYAFKYTKNVCDQNKLLVTSKKVSCAFRICITSLNRP